jgi:hypothetical protein
MISPFGEKLQKLSQQVTPMAARVGKGQVEEEGESAGRGLELERGLVPV